MWSPSLDFSPRSRGEWPEGPRGGARRRTSPTPSVRFADTSTASGGGHLIGNHSGRQTP